MLAMNYRGPYRVRLEEKPMPVILHPEDAIVRVTRSCICGSDLQQEGLRDQDRAALAVGAVLFGVIRSRRGGKDRDSARAETPALLGSSGKTTQGED